MFFLVQYFMPGFGKDSHINIFLCKRPCGKFFIKKVSGFYGKMSVIANFSSFVGNLRVIDHGGSGLFGKMIITKEGLSRFQVNSVLTTSQPLPLVLK